MKSILSLLLFYSLAFTSFAHAGVNDLFDSPCVYDGRIICTIESVKRYQLQNNIAHYELVLKVGTGQFDKIGLHHIVNEYQAWKPTQSNTATMLVHGDAYGFGEFIASLGSQVVSRDHSVAIQMAIAGIDVWGVDLRWTKVPADTPNLDFMADWGVDVDLKDLGTAINVARNIRKSAGNKDVKLNLLGWSRGGQLGYLYLAKESQQKLNKRNIKAFIPVDILLKTDDESIRQSACLYSSLLRQQIAAGKHYDDSGLITQNVAAPAQFLPDELSPLFEGFTNKQAALLLLTSTYLVSPAGSFSTPWYHYNGGRFDGNGLPVDLAFTNLNFMYEYATGAAPYEPARMILETNDLVCKQIDSTRDDHLADISVPILYVYAAGGFGKTGLYTARLTASRDISSIGVQTLPDAMAALDFAHVDLFTATDANARVWQPIIHWIKAH